MKKEYQYLLTVATTAIAFLLGIFLYVMIGKRLPGHFSTMMATVYVLVSARIDWTSRLPVDKHFWIRRILETVALFVGWYGQNLSSS